MGSGIAQIAAQANYKVTILETSSDAIDRANKMIAGSLASVAKRAVKTGKATEEQAAEENKATMARILTSQDMGALEDADLVIEAITENLDVKRSVFSKLNEAVKPEGIFATNTSSFLVADMADATGRPSQFMCTHFFNPVPVMKLVECVRGEQTDAQVYQRVIDWVASTGKVPVKAADTPGFIVNHLLLPPLALAVGMVERGEAAVADIDKAMQLGASHPMGPLTLGDYVGWDTILFVLQGWKTAYPDRYDNPPALLEKMVAEGKLGRKSGSGFFKWEGNKVVGEA